jgi:hypothetical protein
MKASCKVEKQCNGNQRQKMRCHTMVQKKLCCSNISRCSSRSQIGAQIAPVPLLFKTSCSIHILLPLVWFHTISSTSSTALAWPAATLRLKLVKPQWLLVDSAAAGSCRDGLHDGNNAHFWMEWIHMEGTTATEGSVDAMTESATPACIGRRSEELLSNLPSRYAGCSRLSRPGQGGTVALLEPR